jgi:hypothetical protein
MIGEVACVVINLVSVKLLHFARVRWVQMLSNLVFGRAMATPADTALAYLLCFLTGGGLGFIFARFMVSEPGEGNYYFRAVALGIGFTVLAYAVGNTTKTPTMTGIAPATTVTTFLSTLAWGLIVGYLMRRWDEVHA